MRIRKIAQPTTELGEYIQKAGYETNKAFAERIGIEAPMLSMISNKRVLPIRPTMALICEVLGISPLQVWERYELDLLGSYTRRTGRQRIRRWRVEANLGRELYKRLREELKRQGITWQSWILMKAMEEVERCQRS